jgi:hypothetical protein
MKRLFRNAALDPQLEIANHTTAPLSASFLSLDFPMSAS